MKVAANKVAGGTHGIRMVESWIFALETKDVLKNFLRKNYIRYCQKHTFKYRQVNYYGIIFTITLDLRKTSPSLQLNCVIT